ALQAIPHFNKDKYNVVPIYITKQGKWLSGEALLDINNYKDLDSLNQKAEEVYMRPIYGDTNLYKTSGSIFSKKAPVMAELHVALPALHGTHGEDGIFEGILETIGLPYAGCDTHSSANGMDKISMKMILRSCNIPVVDFEWFTERQWNSQQDEIIAKIENHIGYPVIVKPANLGSSVGISIAHNREELKECVHTASAFASRIIAEKMIQDMQEINCSVLGDADDYQTSVCEEPLKTGEFLSYERKYMSGGKGKSNCNNRGMAVSDKRIPADLPEQTSKEIQRLAGETFRVLSCHGVSRVDVMIDRSDKHIYVNEINTIPGSLSYYLWEASGIPFSNLLDRLVSLALKRKREEASKTYTYTQNIFALGGGLKGTKGIKN
ncbi:MAG: D-alanine--D-alanine ligase, partial [Muribaculaceae bacterium]|nr:D-alanine--D-alanine ligase [Muribaculaceae bacterium]